MGYFILIGAALNSILIIAFFTFSQKSNENGSGLSWKRSFLNGIQIYIISLFMGSIFTVVFRYIYENKIAEISVKLFSEIFAWFMYAVIFTFFIVLPALIITLKLISKSSKSTIQKESIFACTSIALVLTVNLMMGVFFKSIQLVIFLSGFSLLGTIIPWLYVRMKKVFASEMG